MLAALNDGEGFLFRILVALAVIIGAARAGAWLFARLGQPQVVGEIAAGLLLGPSFLGRINPDLLQYLFLGETGPIFSVLSQLGLVFLMFLIGLEFDFGHLWNVGRTAGAVALAGIVVPFTLGLGLAGIMWPQVAPEIPFVGFALFLATALSITAIPILGRIMMELNLHRTALGALTITAAAIDDALGWILLAAVSGIVAGRFESLAVTRMFLLTVVFVCLCVGLRPLLVRWAHNVAHRASGEMGLGSLAFLILLVLASAIATNWIGIFSIFGPFVLGAVLSDQRELRDAVTSRLRDFVTVFFLPLFFTFTGLRTDVGLLQTGPLWLFCGMVLMTAIVGKVVGCGLAARLQGMSWRDAGCVAVMMNTRALMGLIAINVGRDLGVIPDSVFCMLVLMAVVTTFMACPLLRRLLAPAGDGHPVR